jgi:hypothetical protein
MFHSQSNTDQFPFGELNTFSCKKFLNLVLGKIATNNFNGNRCDETNLQTL